MRTALLAVYVLDPGNMRHHRDLAGCPQRPGTAMCNDYEQHVAYKDYTRMLQKLELGQPARESERNLPQADDIRIGELGPVMHVSGNAVKLTEMRFGFPPPRPRAAPVFNFRSDGRHFADSQRCLVVASAFFEFTGKKYPKAKHRFTVNREPFFAIAGLWRKGEGDDPPAFAMLTTQPGPDVAPYHDRQVVVLRPKQWADWLYLTKPEEKILAPLPAGALDVETVREGSD